MYGYFLKAKNDNPEEPAPTIIWLSGAESIAEDVYWWCGAKGIARGYKEITRSKSVAVSSC